MNERVFDAFSTIDDDSIVKFQRHTNTAQERVESIQKPAIIYHYNTYMGGANKVNSKLDTVDFLTFEMVEMNLFPLVRNHSHKCVHYVHRV